MKVLITGATGLVGTRLVAKLAAHKAEVNYLTTHKNAIKSQPGYQGFFWNPETGFIDENAIVGVDVIIHLAGASISKRWTRKYKQEIIESRVLSANLLFKLLKDNPNQVKQFISSSAIGIYKDSLTEFYTEDSQSFGDSFLGNVVHKWECAADRFSQLDIPVCKIRTGLVLAPEGGMLPQIAAPVKLGVGSAFGSGKQWQSWIHIDDLIAIYVAALEQKWEGVVNATAPNPVIQDDMMRAVAKTLSRPYFMPNVPEFVMKFVLGEMSSLLFLSQKVKPERALQKGYVFKYPELEPALENLLK